MIMTNSPKENNAMTIATYKRKVRCRPNVHASTTTPVRVTTGVKTKRKGSTSSTNEVEGRT